MNGRNWFGEKVHGLEHHFFGGRFDEIGFGAEIFGALTIALFGGRGENDNVQVAEARLLLDPGEDLEAVEVGEFQIEEDDGRQRVIIPVGEFSDAREVIKGDLAIIGDLDGEAYFGFLQSALHEEDIVLIVFN